MFEFEFDGFIVEVKNQPLDTEFSDDWGHKQLTGLRKSRRMNMKYYLAKNIDLEHAAAVAQKILFALANGTIGGSDLTFNGRSVLAETMKPTSLASGKADVEFRLKLSEAVVFHHQNFNILENAILSLCTIEKSPAVPSRVTSMIESFCSLVGKTKSTVVSGGPGFQMEDEDTMMKVVSFVEKMAMQTLPDYSMRMSFMRICASFESSDTMENMKKAMTLVLKNVISASHRLSK